MSTARTAGLSGSRIRVAQVFWNGDGGGAESSIRDLAVALDRGRFEVRFYFLFSGGRCADEIAAMGYETAFLRWRTWYSPTGRVRLVRLLRAFRPDIVHVHTCAPLTRRLLQLALPSARHIATDHGSLAQIVEALPRSYPHLLLYRLDYRSLDMLITHSPWMARIVHEHAGIPWERIAVVPFGIDLARMVDPSPSIEPDPRGEPAPFRVGFVGRILDNPKGVACLPRVARILADRGFKDFQMVVVGDGPDLPTIVALSEELGVDRLMRFVGWRDDVPSWLRTFNVLLVPSRYEAFGLVVPEALAMGVRVVAFDVGGLGEAAAGSPDAFLVPPGDVRAMAERVIALREAYGVSRSSHSRSHVEATLSAARMASEMESLYERLAGPSPKEVANGCSGGSRRETKGCRSPRG